MTACVSAEKVLFESDFETLTRETYREMMAALQMGERLHYITDHHAFAIAFYTGLRVSELLALRWRDIDLRRGHLIVRHGKGDRTRTVSFGRRVSALFSEFLALSQAHLAAKCTPDDFLFLGRRGPLSPSGIHRRLKFWLAKCGLPPHYSMHSLRHGFATRLLDEGIDINTIRTQLGHSSISTTSVYMHFSKGALQKLREVS